MLTKKDRNTLIKAAFLLEDKGWCQGAFARNAVNSPCDVRNPNAAAHCMLGAVLKIDPMPNHIVRKKLYSSLCESAGIDTGLATFNDDPDTTKEMVTQVLLEAAHS